MIPIFYQQTNQRRHVEDSKVRLCYVHVIPKHFKTIISYPAATAATSPDYVPWHMEDDKVLVALVRGGDPPTKTLMPLAETMCTVARERGVTEVKLVDHSLRPKVKD